MEKPNDEWATVDELKFYRWTTAYWQGSAKYWRRLAFFAMLMWGVTMFFLFTEPLIGK